ncbi:hypothetical protein A8B82_08520 [Sulfitobacter sp. EhC04]|uniref:toll/interleukin-1 receptor domain-containing protein n=1 Tax=Sulfitobacter sp. EhC04 TaxID=1849168 RepID=UPI0007F49313|nr:toll/interleukin-1 receptor domain-containing protein [Sulfitobacter sp. EhC04]OAN78420.1 hypothetical protein A8B82_08520 [Sulfitobacter sp. EhC04]
MSEETRIFISYSPKDQEKVATLCRSLADEPGLTVFLDTEDDLPKQESRPRLEKLIRESDMILFALSPRSAESQDCAWQLGLADGLNKRIIPVVVDHVDGKLPPALAGLNHIYATDHDDLTTAIDSIRSAIGSDIDWIREHTRLAALAHSWSAAARPRAQALRGAELQAAQNWLAGQPKDTPQPTAEQRRFILDSQRAAARRQRSTASGAVAALIVVGVLGVLGWTQRNAAREGERNAEAALRTATEASGALLSDLAQEFSSVPVPAETMRKILGQAQDLHANLIQNFPHDRLLRDNDAMAQAQVGDALYLSGNLKSARKAYQEARNKQMALLAETPDHTGRQHALGVTSARLGDLAIAEGNPAEARKHYTAALDLSLVLDDVDPSLGRHGAGTAGILDKLGRIALGENDLTRAEDLFTQAHELRAALIKRDPANPDWQNEYAASLGSLAGLSQARDTPSIARDLLQQALEIRERLVALAPDNVTFKHDAAVLLDALADIARELGDTDLSRAYLDRGLDLARAMVQIDPQNGAWQRDLAVSLNNIGTADQNAGDYEAAKTYFEQGRDIIQRLVLISPTELRWQYDLGKVEMRLAQLAELMDNPEAAKTHFEAAGEIFGNLAAEQPDNPTYASDLGMVFSGLGTHAHQTDDPGSAAQHHAKALDWRRRAAELLPHDPGSQRAVTGSLYEIAALQEERKDYDAALQGYREMLSHARTVVTAFPQDSDLADDLRVAGDLFAKQAAIVSFGDVLFSRLDKAETLAREALEAAPDNRRVAAHLAYALMFQDKTDAAKEIFLAERGTEIDGDPWEMVVQQDFETFRKIGLTHPLMGEVEAAF